MKSDFLFLIVKVIVFFALMTWSIIDNKIEIPAFGWVIVFCHSVGKIGSIAKISLSP